VSTVLKHLGIPIEDFGRFREWSMALMRARAEGGAVPGVLDAAAASREAMLGYLGQLTQQRESAGGETARDVLSVLVAACDEGAIEPDEMIMMLVHISLAGNGPTAMALGNALAALAAFPEVQTRLRHDPSLVPAAVEELLRFDSSTHFIVRFALRDAKLGARTVRAGQQVHVMVGAANRDPARFPEPDTVDIDRPDNRHLAFGHGIHFCLGAPLARLELQVALSRFLERVAAFEALEGQRAPSYQVRGYQRLMLREKHG
jgi:cytochrome P450